MSVRSGPCTACPYRCDVPPGVWHPDEYDKLPPYDAPTCNQPLEAFMCHATPESMCHGWAVVHSNRGHENELIALRMRGEVAPDHSPVELFGSGTEAAEHGRGTPTVESVETMGRLLRKHERLR